MKLLITGANGFVAGSVIAQAKENWKVTGVGKTEITGLPNEVKWMPLDLTDKGKVSEVFSHVKPDAVIHTAAMANIDVCQTNQTMAKSVNVTVTETLADLCNRANAKMIFCSTDTVFDGTKGNYTEADKPHPVNFYAETKIKAEQIVLNASAKNAVARLSLVMGLPVLGKGNSFLIDTIEKLKKGESMKFPENEIRTPVDVITLGAALIELAGNNFGGIIHLSGNTKINRYQMALQIAETLDYSTNLIISTNSNAMKDRAPRPNDASMDNSLAKKILQTPMRSLADGLNLTLNFKMKE